MLGLNDIFRKLAFMLASSAAVYSVVLAQQKPTKQIREPKFFNAETPIRRPVKIPRSVLQQLEQHENVIGCSSVREDRERNRRVDLSKYFRAASVNLDNDGHVDLVVQPESGACLSANTAPFWVFRNTGKGYQLVFSIEALGISLSKRKTNGLRNIETGVATAIEYSNTVFKFDGEVYKPKVCTVENFETKRKAQVPCSEFGFQEN